MGGVALKIKKREKEDAEAAAEAAAVLHKNRFLNHR